MNFKMIKKIVSALIVLFLIVGSSNLGFAENTGNIPSRNICKSLCTRDVEKFSDDFLKESMETNFVPGAVVVVVKDGEVIFKKGYGYSDLESKESVNSASTLFHIGSVGKLFTQTATMQLYERGKIKLSDDINKYLGSIQIKGPYSKQVSIENLLTHTDGFEESSFIGSAAKTFETKVSYEKFIRDNIPYVLDKPGTVAHYTNIGTDILGYIVQRASGSTYSEFIDKNIFMPLKMDRSEVSPQIMPKGYDYINGRYELCPDVYYNGTGSGDIVSTGNDMAKFMVAHLQTRKLASESVLKPETLANMHKQHFTSNVKMSGMAYGFYEANQNGQRVIKHDGAVQGFISALFLIPDKGVGVFISTNSTGSENKVNSLTFDYQTEFMNYFYPQQEKKVIKPTEYKAYYQKLVGTYRNYDNVSKARLSKIAALIPPGLDSSILIDKDDNLVLKGHDLTGKTINTKLCEVEPYLFIRSDNGSNISFKTASDGTVDYLFRDEPFDSYEKISFYETMPFNLILLGFCMLFFIIFLSKYGVKLLIRLIKKQKILLLSRDINILLAGLICFLNISGIVGVFVTSMIHYWDFQFAMPNMMYIFLIEIILAGLLTLVLLFRVIIARKPEMCLSRKVSLSSVVFVSVVLLLFAYQWNLIGFKW